MAVISNKLLEATKRLLINGSCPEDLTVREIAKEADSAPGMINYYFRGKENLIQEAINSIMLMKINTLNNGKSSKSSDIKEQLIEVLSSNAELGERFEKLYKYTVIEDYKNGAIAASHSILPILRKFYFGEKDEAEIRILASQILLPIQSYYINHEKLLEGVDLDLSIEGGREKLIRTIVNNLLD